MTIQDWGAVGEIVGALAVVVTLAYLATQIRYARVAANDASRQGRADGVREILVATMTDPELRRVWMKADPSADARMERLSGKMGLTKDEAYLAWHVCCAWTFVHWAQYRSMKSTEDEQELENLVSSFYSIPPMAPIWETDELLKALLDPGFVAWVDDVLAKQPKG